MTELSNGVAASALNHISQRHWRHPDTASSIMPQRFPGLGPDYCSAAVHKEVLT